MRAVRFDQIVLQQDVTQASMPAGARHRSLNADRPHAENFSVPL
jgi:hypothetical protein